MRIPPSVFVMSLVTAVPFGLAVKDTLHPPKTRAEIEADKERQYELDMQKQAEADRQAEEQRTATVFGGLLGEPGKLGTYLDGIAVGAPADQAEQIKERAANASDLIDFVYTEHDGKVESIAIAAGGGSCSDLLRAVRTKWGEGPRWIDAATHTYAQLDEDDCELTLDRYVDVEQFLDKTLAASIPIGALGKAFDALPEDLQQYDTPARLGLAQGGPANIELSSNDAGKVIGLSASFKVDALAEPAVLARLQQLFGKGTQDPDTGEWDWKGKVPVHYAYSNAHGYLDIGQP
jgi:hypothetical protein